MTVCACDRCPVLKLELPRAADLSLGIQGRQRVRPGPLRLRAPHNFTIPKRCPTRPTLPSSSGQRHHLAPKSCLSRNRERAFWAACERPISSQRISCDALAWALFWHASGLSLFAAAAARKAKRSAYAVSFIRNGDDTSVMANENSLRRRTAAGLKPNRPALQMFHDGAKLRRREMGRAGHQGERGDGQGLLRRPRFVGGAPTIVRGGARMVPCGAVLGGGRLWVPP